MILWIGGGPSPPRGGCDRYSTRFDINSTLIFPMAVRLDTSSALFQHDLREFQRGGPFWEAFYIENKRFDLDTLRVPNRSPTPILKSNDFLRQSDYIWGARGPHFRSILGLPGVRAGLNGHHVRSL